MMSLDDHPQLGKQNKCLSPSRFTTFKCTEKSKCLFSTVEKHFLENSTPEIKQWAKICCQTGKTPCWLHLLLLQLLLNLPFLQHQNLKYSRQQKNLFGCLLTTRTRDRMEKNKPITFNKPHTNHLGFPTSKSLENIEVERYIFP